jgi:hypothetical protein
MKLMETMFGLHDGVRVRGIGLSASRAYVKERFGAAGWTELLAALPDERVAAVWDALILPAGWYAMPLFDAFLDALESVFGETTAAGEELGRRIARAEIHHRIFIDPGNDLLHVLDDSPRLWSAYFSDGAFCVLGAGGDTIELALHNPGLHRLVCREVVVGWGNEILEAAGATVVENEHYRCVLDGDSTCRYRVRWRPPAKSAAKCSPK